MSALAAASVRIGVVSFLNTLPLVDGLDKLEGLELRHSVPSLLIDQLVAGDVDIALCSSIDYQRGPVGLRILPVGLLGCNGPTLTVRLYSSTPIDRLERVYCDTDSHTSVALLRILLAERHGITPELVAYDAREHVAENRPVDWPDAMLLIGDKVVTDSPPAVRYPHQLDLGAAWHEYTRLPFTFALWLAGPDVEPDRVRTAAMALDRQRRRNASRLAPIVHDRAIPRGWPADLATDYLGNRIRFEFNDAHRAGLERFYDECVAHGLLTARRPLLVERI